MNEYSKKILKVPTVTFVREQDQGKQPVLDVRRKLVSSISTTFLMKSAFSTRLG